MDFTNKNTCSIMLHAKTVDCKSEHQADAMAKKRYAAAGQKTQVEGEELEKLNQLVSPLIKKGQPLTHIYVEHKDELPVSQRTLYNYIGAGMLSIGNLDLRRKVGYRPRKKIYHPSIAFLHQECRQNRTYEDFQAYMAKHSSMPYVELGTVKDVRERGKRMLTMHFVEQNIMLIFLIRLTSILGLETLDTYCPEARVLIHNTQEDMVLLMNHINSTKRKSLGGRVPYELATTREFKKLMQVLDLHLLPTDDVNLNPKLLKRKTES